MTFVHSVDENGRKKTISVTYQCCRGFGRKKNSKSTNIQMPCEELHLRSLIETTERLDGREFVRSAQKNDIDEALRKNVTLFMPTDAVFTEFAEQLLESVMTNVYSGVFFHTIVHVSHTLQKNSSHHFIVHI